MATPHNIFSVMTVRVKVQEKALDRLPTEGAYYEKNNCEMAVRVIPRIPLQSLI